MYIYFLRKKLFVNYFEYNKESQNSTKKNKISMAAPALLPLRRYKTAIIENGRDDSYSLTGIFLILVLRPKRPTLPIQISSNISTSQWTLLAFVMPITTTKAYNFISYY